MVTEQDAEAVSPFGAGDCLKHWHSQLVVSVWLKTTPVTPDQAPIGPLSPPDLCVEAIESHIKDGTGAGRPRPLETPQKDIWGGI